MAPHLMLTKIRLNDGTTLDFDTEDLPLGENLQPFLEVLKGSDIPTYEQFRVAHIYRSHYDECKTILDFIKRNREDSEEQVKLLEKALDLQHGKEVSLDGTNILKGFLSYKKKDLTTALANFTKERFSFGIDLCNYFYGSPENPLLRSLAHLRNLNHKEFESAKEFLSNLLSRKDLKVGGAYGEFITIRREVLQDTLYGLRLADSFNDPNNLDVKQRIAEDSINKGKFEGVLDGLDFVDKNYLLGKIEHIKGNYNEAKQFYKKCITEGNVNTRSYVLSRYAYERIVQDTPLTYKFSSEEFNDLNIFLKFKNNVEVGDLSGCSEDMRNFIVINKGVSENLESCIMKYDLLVNNKYMEKFVGLNNLIYFKNRKRALFYKGEPLYGPNTNKEYLKMIKEAVEASPSDIKEALLYNQAYLSLDSRLFESLSAKEASVMAAYLKKDSQVLKEMNLIELVACLRDREASVELLSNKSSLFSNLLLGKLYLKKYIENKMNIDLSFAISYFLKEPKSFYSANGLGVCLALQKKFPEAIKVFNSVVIDYEQAHNNLGNVYILNGEYEKGVMEHLRHPTNSLQDLVLLLKDKLSVDLIMTVFRLGFKGLKEVIFERLILEDRLEEAKDYKVANKRLKSLFDKKVKENEKKAEELKRKIEELENYKRSKNIK